MQNWFETVREKTDSIIEAIKTQDFIKNLIDGTLAEEVFMFYICQDNYYLEVYKKNLSNLAAKLPDQAHEQFFLDSATGIIEVENVLHESYLKNQTSVIEISPSCELYISYLSRIIFSKNFEEGLAAVLPCFTIYQEIGDYILSKQEGVSNNPYKSWIDMYGSEEFAKTVEEAIAIANHYASTANEKTLKGMEEAFVKASKLEWLFWESANRLEQWEI